MKKLVVTALIVCAAVASQAATLKWSLSGVTATEAGTGAAAGNIAYFLADSTYSTFSGLSSDKIAGFCAENGLYSAQTAAGRTGVGVTASSGTYAAGDTISGYIVLFDAKTAADADYYAASSVLSVKVAAAGDPSIAVGFKDTTGWKSLASTPTPPGPTPDVPEPTSGLLLVFGGAALALRRRR